MATYLPNVTDIFPEPALYTPNFSYIDTMLRRRQALYDQGFAEISSEYQNISRDVTNAKNAVERDKFIKQAQDNIKNLAAADLSQRQNVDAARNVFKPFYSNVDILGDMAYTSHVKQQLNIAESYRLKDGGKEFSEDNVNYIRKQQQEFANSDPSSWKQFYGNKRYYTPYYDYYKEVQEKMKDFKPSSYEYDHVKGLYKVTTKNSSWSEAEVSEYLNGVLSDKAKQQMRIEADVRIGNNPELLAPTYLQNAQQQLEMNNYNIKNIDKQLALTNDPNKKVELNRKKEVIDNYNRELNTNIDNIKKGDYSYLKNNSEKLSYLVYFNGKLSGFVKSFAHDEKVQKLDGDEVGIALMKEARADARQIRSFEHSEKMKKWELGMVPGNFQVRDLAEGENGINLQTTINGLQEGISEHNREIALLTNASKQYILMKVRERDPNTKLTLDDITGSFINNWIKTGGSGGSRILSTDPYFQNEKEIAAIASRRNSLQNRIDKIEQGAFKNMTSQEQAKVKQVNNTIASMGNITLDDGTSLSATELATGLRNGTISASMNLFNRSGSIKINGKTYQVDDRLAGKAATPIRNNLALLSAFEKIKSVQSSAGDAYEKFIKNRDNFMKDNFAELRLGNKVITFDAGGVNAKSLEASASSLIPNSGLDFQHAGVGATASNQGDAYFYITPKSGSDKTVDDIEKELIAGGVKVRVIKTEKGPAIFQIKGLNNNIANQYRQYSPREVDVISELQSFTGSGEYQSTPFTTAGGDTKFVVKKFGGMYYLHILDINGLGESFPDVYSTPADAISAARILSASGGAQKFKQFSKGSTSTQLDMSGANYDYRYE